MSKVKKFEEQFSKENTKENISSSSSSSSLLTIHPSFHWSSSSSQCKLTHMKMLSERMHRLLYYTETCDVVFRVSPSTDVNEAEDIPAHRCIVSAIGKSFDCMLNGPFKESQQTVIEIFEVLPEAFRYVLEYAYCGMVDVEAIHLLDVMHTADRFALDDLRYLCESAIEDSVDVHRVCGLLESAIRFQATSLWHTCWDYIMENGDAVFSHPSIAQLDMDSIEEIVADDMLCAEEENVFKGVVLWAKYNLGFQVPSESKLFDQDEDQEFDNDIMENNNNNNNNNNNVIDEDNNNNNNDKIDTRPSNIKKKLRPIMKGVRFDEMSIEFIYSQVVPLNIVPKSIILEVIFRKMLPLMNHQRYSTNPLSRESWSSSNSSRASYVSTHSSSSSSSSSSNTTSNNNNNNNNNKTENNHLNNENNSSSSIHYQGWKLGPRRFRYRKVVLDFEWDPQRRSQYMDISTNRKTVSFKGDALWRSVLGSRPTKPGKNYWEIIIEQTANSYLTIGVCESSLPVEADAYQRRQAWMYYCYDGSYYHFKRDTVYGKRSGPKDRIGILFDSNDGSMVIYRNGRSLGKMCEGLPRRVFPFVALFNRGDRVSILSNVEFPSNVN